jgi:hypothetical protein
MDTKKVYCPNCGKQITDDGTFCSKCGTNIHTYRQPPLLKREPEKKNNDLIKGIIIGVCIIIIAISMLVIVGSIGNLNSSGLIVENVSVSDDMFGQKFTADIMPDKDYEYLGAVIIYYDDNGAVLNTNNLLWNMLDVQKGQPIKMQGESYSYDYAGSPAYAKILFFDSSLNQKEEDAIFVYTINYK